MAHPRTRTTIGRAIGMLKRRFACLGHPLRTKLETSETNYGCGVLYNIATAEKVPIPNEENIDEAEHVWNP